MSDPVRVGDLDEDELIARIQPQCPVGEATLLGPGDDAAILATDASVVVSTDVLVEDRHFRRSWSTGSDVGWRAAVQNLADIAAMGATPTGIVASLVLPADLPVSWFDSFARGMAQVCAPLGIGVVGGDLSSGDAIVASVTVLGSLGGRAPVLRSGACVGDLVVHAGVLGHAGAGLALLAVGDRQTSPALVKDYLRPRPPIVSGPEIADAGAHAMLDVSDGLLKDASRIAAASGVLIDLDLMADALAQESAALRVAADTLAADLEEWVFTGGEDHGLLATIAPGAALPVGFRPIGHVRAWAEPGPRVLIGGRPARWSSWGWDHFGTPG